MKNPIILLIVGLALIVVLTYAVSASRKSAETPPASSPTEQAASDREVRGTVTSVDTSGVPADGPALVTIQAEDGSAVVVAVRSMGINLCPAQANITDVYKLKAGDRVEARGSVEAEGGSIVPCESSAHYLRLAAQ